MVNTIFPTNRPRVQNAPLISEQYFSKSLEISYSEYAPALQRDSSAVGRKLNKSFYRKDAGETSRNPVEVQNASH